jgi:hypothetical protein
MNKSGLCGLQQHKTFLWKKQTMWNAKLSLSLVQSVFRIRISTQYQQICKCHHSNRSRNVFIAQNESLGFLKKLRESFNNFIRRQKDIWCNTPCFTLILCYHHDVSPTALHSEVWYSILHNNILSVSEKYILHTNSVVGTPDIPC